MCRRKHRQVAKLSRSSARTLACCGRSGPHPRSRWRRGLRTSSPGREKSCRRYRASLECEKALNTQELASLDPATASALVLGRRLKRVHARPTRYGEMQGAVARLRTLLRNPDYELDPRPEERRVSAASRRT